MGRTQAGADERLWADTACLPARPPTDEPCPPACCSTCRPCQVPGAKRVAFSDVWAKPRAQLLGREFTAKDWQYLIYMSLVHAGALLAPFYFSWSNVATFMGAWRVRACVRACWVFGGHG